MNSSTSPRAVPAPTSPAASPPGAAAVQTLPGHDAGRDSARHYAAVGIFALAGLAMVGVVVGAYAFRPADAPAPTGSLFGLDAGNLLPTGVAADAPMLRPGFEAERRDAITVFDASTGQREIVGAPAELDTADAAAFSGDEATPLAR
ncbi:hypothetical protein [Ancylobacter sp. TS-1]|uniref:hypothetical protein n=1 Tax=Ancylobacter sp. TS-1 TaxID=1850374 RepID=UPI001265C2B8|nr:hypothetical protein [Ancylobacter sp. TS-1]QFR33654.1 hypothetical protein GBB76_11285 [Ancylobacter sp. TS-1]